MSQENVEIVRAALEAFNRRDVETFEALFAPDAEIVPVRAAVEGTVYRGLAAGSQYLAAVEDSWENLRWEVEEVRDVNTAVLALGTIEGKGRDSGVSIDARSGWVVRCENGLITNFQTFPDRTRALEALGLRE